MVKQTPSKTLNILLWFTQVFLAFMFLWAGYMKLFQSVDQLSAMMSWAPDVPLTFIRFIGICEVLGAIGLVLPSLLQIKPRLTSWAAIGCTILMLSATIFHISRGEVSHIGFNIFLGLAAIFIAWGRFKKIPIQPKHSE